LNLLAKSETARLEIERAFHELQNRIELDYAAHKAQVEVAYAANRRLLAERRGLYDARGSGGGACRGDIMSTNSDAARDDSDSPTGCQLSGAASEDLLELARDADRAAIYAQACHQWAVNIGKAIPSVQ
jgi:hypothetical protein